MLISLIFANYYLIWEAYFYEKGTEIDKLLLLWETHAIIYQSSRWLNWHIQNFWIRFLLLNTNSLCVLFC